ncbi:diguanylate cyclase (GGDEF)-like protein [Actinoplanes tereljensis]|uniref:Diguanylate cyclase (GGDEF)-like protein n=1 Tax=Paractinoplanes tereljensis TaxID=571912 RepID=A0A919NQZ9_9ACTN|nr:bifunctional diguanylate cyclase/phosphodiesterase [Actinoplanes tereljensis]GIF23514.1 hypothetical protein Ate02nite_62440 [Actinoplanes tereljensis]
MARTAQRWRAWFVPVAVVLAAAQILLIVLGTHTAFPKLLVWLSATGGVAVAVASFRSGAVLAGGVLLVFWRRLAVAMGFVLVAGLSQTFEVVTTSYTGMPPIGARTLLLYVVGTILAITAMLRLPAGGRSWRQLTTAVLDVAVVAVTAGIAGSQYTGWFVDRFGVSASAWWLNIAMMAIAVAGVVVVVKIMASRGSPVPPVALWWLAPIGLAGPLSTVLMSALSPWPYLNGSAAVLPFVGLFGTLAAHAQHRHLTRSRPRRALTMPLVVSVRGTAVPLVATVVTCVSLVSVFVRTGRLAMVEVAGMTVLLVLVVARQALALAENATLLRTVGQLAMHDDLTGLVNRRHFTAAVAATAGPCTVVLIDLKDFRALNDGLGSDAADALLIAYGRRLTRLAGEESVVARLGGDEFGLLLAEAPAVSVLDRLLAAGTEPLHAAGHEVLVDASIGVADRADDGSADVYRQAEIALREAMTTAGGRLVRYDASLERQLTQQATLAADLRRAMAAGEFQMRYQPIVELPHGRMVAVEALIRWVRPDGQVVSPEHFIPVAEDTGLIVELGEWIIDTVCAQTADWRSRPGAEVLRSVAVNVSARQLLDPGLPQVVADALARYDIPADQLTIEITETAVFGGGRALATVNALAQLGVSISLDDFGTGHSSLGLLRTCPVHAIKIDKSFVDGLGGTPQQEAIVTALVGIADTMGLRTVAEGVETADQAHRLFELGYHHAQGFHFARPLPASAITAMLQGDHQAAA